MEISRRSFGLAALGGTLLTAVPALAKAPFAGTQAPGIYRFKLGDDEVTVLSDGWLPIDAKIFSGDPAGAGKLLEGAFLPKDKTPTSVNEWVVNTGDNLVLVDTGTSTLFGPTVGRMPKNLAAAGMIRPTSISSSSPIFIQTMSTACSPPTISWPSPMLRCWSMAPITISGHRKRLPQRRRTTSSRSSPWHKLRSSLTSTPAR